MEDLIVLIIICLAFLYVGRTFYKYIRGRGKSACGCSACPASMASDLTCETDKKECTREKI